MKHTLAILLLAGLLTALSSFATEQIPERIIINGVEKKLFTYPLGAYLERLDKTPKVVSSCPHTALYRGYVGTWTIRDNELWLISYSTVEDNGVTMKEHRLGRLNKWWWWRDSVKAEWFSGELCIVDGKRVINPDDLGSYEAYERYLMLAVEEGKIVKHRYIDLETKQAEDRAGWDEPYLAVIGPDVELKTVAYDPHWYGSTVGMAVYHGITEEAFRKLNGLGPEEELKPGARVKVPCYYR